MSAMRYEIVFGGRIVDAHDQDALIPDEAVESFVDEAVAELERLRAEDISVSTTLSTATVAVSVTVAAESLEDAQALGNSQIRAAFHAADVATPDWTIDWTSVSAVREDEREPIDA